jgi:hypothetical protein
MAMAHELDENPSKVSINAGISLSPDKRRTRTSEVLVRQMSGYATNQEVREPKPKLTCEKGDSLRDLSGGQTNLEALQQPHIRLESLLVECQMKPID